MALYFGILLWVLPHPDGFNSSIARPADQGDGALAVVHKSLQEALGMTARKYPDRAAEFGPPFLFGSSDQ